jgi:hypothetical protein
MMQNASRWKNIGNVMHDEQCRAYAVVAYKATQISRKCIFLSKKERGNKPHGGTKITKREGEKEKNEVFILFYFGILAFPCNTSYERDLRNGNPKDNHQEPSKDHDSCNLII